MHGRIARYRISGDPHELARKAEEGMLPIFEAQPGFRAYNLAISGDTLTSMSAWDTMEQAEAASPAAASWIAENIAEDIELLDVQFAEILLATALGVSAAATASRPPYQVGIGGMAIVASAASIATTASTSPRSHAST